MRLLIPPPPFRVVIPDQHLVIEAVDFGFDPLEVVRKLKQRRQRRLDREIADAARPQTGFPSDGADGCGRREGKSPNPERGDRHLIGMHRKAGRLERADDAPIGLGCHERRRALHGERALRRESRFQQAKKPRRVELADRERSRVGKIDDGRVEGWSRAPAPTEMRPD